MKNLLKMLEQNYPERAKMLREWLLLLSTCLDGEYCKSLNHNCRLYEIESLLSELNDILKESGVIKNGKQ